MNAWQQMVIVNSNDPSMNTMGHLENGYWHAGAKDICDKCVPADEHSFTMLLDKWMQAVREVEESHLAGENNSKKFVRAMRMQREAEEVLTEEINKDRHNVHALMEMATEIERLLDLVYMERKKYIRDPKTSPERVDTAKHSQAILEYQLNAIAKLMNDLNI